jgi:XapX domain-containing protein
MRLSRLLIGKLAAQRNGGSSMKDLLISFAVGAFVGLLYGVIKVKSPAPPIIALLGLLGMVIGEQVGGWVHTRRANVADAAATCISGKHWNPPTQAADHLSVLPQGK